MNSTVQTLEIDASAPHFSLPGTDGHSYSLSSFGETKYLGVVFLANHCPYVAAWEDRLMHIARHYAQWGVQWVAISSNDVEKFPADSLDKMRERVEEKEYPFPYLYDEDQSVARDYGATRTPEVFLFDDERHLVYHGAIDSDWEESAEMQNYLRDALTLLHSGQGVSLAETPPVGCTIKWKS